MKMVGSLTPEPIGALSLKNQTVVVLWSLTLVLVIKTNFGLLQCTLETLMFSRIKPLISASNSLVLVILRLYNAITIHSSNLAWMRQVLDLGVHHKALGVTTIAMSLAPSHSLLLSQSPTPIVLQIL